MTLSMGGYGAYLWTSVAIFLVVLALEAIGAAWQRRTLVEELRGRQRRQAARGDRDA